MVTRPAGGVRARPLAGERARLKSVSKRAKYQSKRQRAMVFLASSTATPAPQIAAVVRSDESHARKVIRAFNVRGFGSFDPDYRGGRPRRTTSVERNRIVWSRAHTPADGPRSRSTAETPQEVTVCANGPRSPVQTGDLDPLP